MTQSDFFLKIDGIEGASQDDIHKGDIDSFHIGGRREGAKAK